MCYHVSTPSLKEMKAFLDKQPKFTIDDYMPYYHVNGFAHPQLPVITADDPTHISMAVWGLIPFFVKTEKDAKATMKKTLNAKAETLFTTPMYREAAKRNRCLVIVNGFFEWKWDDPSNAKSEKTPHFIYMPDGKPFTFGGVYSDWRSPEGGITRTVSIITTQANNMMADIHNTKQRMPFVNPEDSWDMWLNPEADIPSLETLMRPFPEDGLQFHVISKLITQRGADTNVKEVQEVV